MKKFSTRKIAALALVFCLFLSVFANTGMFTAKAATEVSASYTYSGSLTDLTFGVNGGYAAGTWSWVNGSDLVGVSGSKSGNTYTVTWDSEVYAGVQLWIYSGTLGKTEYPSLNPGDNKSIYSTADGFTYTDPNTGTTATATVTYVPSLSSSSWFGVTSCEYIGDGSTSWPSFWLASGSNEYVAIAQSGNTWTITWDTTKVTKAWAELGAKINGTDYKVYPALTAGSSVTYYDSASGLTTEKPAPVRNASASIVYHGASDYVQPIGNGYSNSSGWVDGCDTWQTASDDNITFAQSGNTYTLSWDSANITEIYVIVAGNSVANGWVQDLKVTLTNGSVIDIYDTSDGSNFTTQEPSVAYGTITYMGSQTGSAASVSATLLDGTVETFNVGEGSSNSYVKVLSTGNVYKVQWDPAIVASANLTFSVTGDFTDSYSAELTDGQDITLYDINNELADSIPATYSSATIIYMGDHSTWTYSYGLTPKDNNKYGWWIDDSASAGSPVGTHTIYSGSGNTHTYTWNGDVASVCWVHFACAEYTDPTVIGLRNGTVMYIYDKDVLGYFSAEAPKMVTSNVVVNSEDTTWAGVTALCKSTGEWVSGLWIDNNANDYGITVTKTVADGRTTYSYTYDQTQITTVCVQVGTTNVYGDDSNLWVNLSGKKTRQIYITDEYHTVTTFPPGHTYVKPGTGEGIDGSVMIHYVRENGDYSGWYFGYWYEVDGQWFSYNKTFAADGTFTLPLNDIPAAQIGFVVNYNDWASKDIEEDRFIDLSKLVADENGLYHIYLYSGDATVYYEPKA